MPCPSPILLRVNFKKIRRSNLNTKKDFLFCEPLYLYFLQFIYIVIQGASKKTGIMEFCIFCIIKGGFTIEITVSNTYMIKSIQLALIQAFTAP